jgi:ribosome maturation factor RimP
MQDEARQQLEQQLGRIGAETAAGLGLELVEVALGRSRHRWSIRMDIERPGPRPVSLEDCEQVSRAVGAILDARDLVPGRYTLEVSSPGIDRPIRTPDDIRRNTGRRIVVETVEPLDGRRSFWGVLVGLEGDGFRLRQDTGDEVFIPIRGIAKARQDAAF